MNMILAFLSLVGLCSLHAVLGVDISTTLTKPMPTGNSVLVEKFALPNITMITPVHGTASSTRTAIPLSLPPTIRNKRQIAYGALGSGMASGLSGISSGYGYGYNNAVGLQGQGMGHGSGSQMAPMFGGMGGMGMMGGLGYGALPVGGNIGALGMAGLNGGYGPVGYGGVVPVGGLGAGGAGWLGGAAPITSAIVPTTGGGAYGRSDDVPVSVPLDTQSVPLNTQSDVASNQPINLSTQG